MKRVYLIAVALLVFSLVLGVGSLALGTGDEAPLEAISYVMPVYHVSSLSPCDPRLDPNCGGRNP